MPNTQITQGFILAAGMGERMRPLTNDIPKPMVLVHGKPIIGYVLDAFAAHGINTCVINTHYQPAPLLDYLATRHDLNIIISHEPELLDTGGGIKQGLKYLDNSKPAFIASGDSIWQNPPHNTTLALMESAWDENVMDMLLLLQPLSTMTLTQGIGDYNITHTPPHFYAHRTPDKSGTHIWTSLRIINPAIMQNAPDGAFSFLSTLDKAEQSSRLHALSHTGIWHHLSTPHDIETLNRHWQP